MVEGFGAGNHPTLITFQCRIACLKLARPVLDDDVPDGDVGNSNVVGNGRMGRKTISQKRSKGIFHSTT